MAPTGSKKRTADLVATTTCSGLMPMPATSFSLPDPPANPRSPKKNAGLAGART
jgi:hypothetical protein